MKKLYELAVKSGTYTSKDGSEKSIWLNIGSVWQGNDDTTFMLLRAAFNPAGVERKNGSDSISVSMFPPKDNEQSTQEDSSQSNSDDYPDGPIPF